MARDVNACPRIETALISTHTRDPLLQLQGFDAAVVIRAEDGLAADIHANEYGILIVWHDVFDDTRDGIAHAQRLSRLRRQDDDACQ